MENVFIKKEELNKWLAKYFEKDLISIEELLCKMEDMDHEISNLEEKIEDMENDIKDNYTRKSDSELYGIKDNDFV